MRTPLAGIIGIFSFTLTVLFLYSLRPEELSITFKRADTSEITINNKLSTSDNICTTAGSEVDSKNTNTDKVVDTSRKVELHADTIINKEKSNLKDSTKANYTVDTSKVRILICGDSMQEVLMYRLNDYCTYLNYDLNAVIWFSSSTKYWGRQDTLKYYINKFKPNYIIFVIGGNELFIRDIKKAREAYVRSIERQLGNIPSIWVGPPNWKPDTGINDLILSIVGPSRFFLSKNLTFTRLSDGAHPDAASGARWMDTLAVWIKTKCKYPLRLDFPPKKALKSAHAIRLTPPKD